jgi:hypothetical protein
MCLLLLHRRVPLDTVNGRGKKGVPTPPLKEPSRRRGKMTGLRTITVEAMEAATQAGGALGKWEEDDRLDRRTRDGHRA